MTTGPDGTVRRRLAAVAGGVIAVLALSRCSSNDPAAAPTGASGAAGSSGASSAGGSGGAAGVGVGGGGAAGADDGGVDAAPPCAPPGVAIDLAKAQTSYPKLSDYCLFDVTPDTLVPRARVFAYDLTTPLFSDYTLKARFVWLPEGTSAAYADPGPLDFPTGTIIAKTFSVAADLRDPAAGARRIETRLLVRGENDWAALPYVWNDEQTEATLAPGGQFQHLSWIHTDGTTHETDYLVPSTNQCKKCHEDDAGMGILGPKARNLNRDFDYPDGKENQLARLTRLGLLTGAPAPDDAPRAPVWNDPSTGTLDQRARTWLDVNCAHCHHEGGKAGTSGLYLSSLEAAPARFGVCKPPVAAGGGSGGLQFDVFPGQPDQSIMAFRLASTDPKIMMPELGRSVVHDEGLALIREWITSLDGDCKNP